LQNFPRPIGATVIDHHDLVRHLTQAKLDVQVLDRGGDAALFVPGRDND
jgi:hypothetical protein